MHLGGRRSAEVLAREGAEGLAVKLVGAGLGLGGHRGAGNLLILGLVIGGDDLVFADGELRKRIALREELPGHPAFPDVVLLTYTINKHVDRAVVLRPAAQ
jgi:hypothetical protein